MSESSAMLIRNATTAQAVTRKREEYRYLPDLAEFERDWQQQVEPDNPDSYLEFSWRGVDISGQHWREFTNRYRTITDAFGQIYHVSQNLGVESVSTPLPVSV